MSKKTTLLIMAAGMGSRFGGLKQIEPVGPNGEIIIDYSVFDAKRAGFDKTVFIIKREFEKEFRDIVGKRMEKMMDVDYAFQQMEKIPPQFSIPEGRDKPWGTGHAIMCAQSVVDTPFCVINADDFYGRDAFESVAAFFRDAANTAQTPMRGCLVAHRAQNTMTTHGSVSRACCDVDDDGHLTALTERIKLIMQGDKLHDMVSGEFLSPDTLVSCTMYGLPPEVLPLLWREFELTLQAHKDDLSSVEFYLPTAIDALLKKGELVMSVTPTESRWYGFTYQEDRDKVVAALEAMTQSGEYPSPLWG